MTAITRRSHLSVVDKARLDVPPRVMEIDPQVRSVWLEDGTRLGFAEARRRGYDVEAELERLLQESVGRHPSAPRP